MALISRLPRDPGLQVEDLGIKPDITVGDHKYSGNVSNLSARAES
jgi:hypothetical protein